MPNHVNNIITYEGDKKQIAKMLEAIKNDEFGIGTVDFNKIIPMPDDIYTGNLGPKEREIYGDKNWYDCYAQLCITVVMPSKEKCEVFIK